MDPSWRSSKMFVARASILGDNLVPMSLTSGTRLGAYEILTPLGAGGMGEVYKARDTRLDRIVAVKILPETLAADPQFRERFDREARAVSQLDHPNICTLHDVGAHQGLSFLVMQYLEGETLETRLQRGAMPLDQALSVAIQIASALDKAHRAGIVHRDLKPGNIFLVRGGVSGSTTAKLLDFGLAKTVAIGDAAGASMPPTTPLNLTARGTVLGTFQYMAPEQVEGREADQRTDIFAFGAVLYETVAGRRAFEGQSPASVIAKILESEPPPISSLQPMTPPTLDRVVKKCLAKDPDARWQSAGDLASELQWIAEGGSRAADGRLDAGAKGGRQLPSLWMAASGLFFVLAAVAGVAWWRASRPVDRPLLRMSIQLIPQRLGGGNRSFQIDQVSLYNSRPGGSLALSPDGSRLVATTFGADRRQRLAIRKLDQDAFDPLAGTENGTAPFFKPDGQSIGFFAEGKLKTMPVEGGSPVTLCDAGNFPSASWGENGTIVAALGGRNGPLSTVPANGGPPAPLTTLEAGEIGHAAPQVLPDGEILFTTYSGGGADVENARIEVVSLETRKRMTVVRGGEWARYVALPSGASYLIYFNAQALFAAPFDLASHTVKGAAKRMLTDVTAIHSGRLWGDFDVSQNGTFVYFSGAGESENSIFWLDQTGKVEPLHPDRGLYSGLRFSPDGSRLAFVNGDVLGHTDLWIQNLQRNTVERLTTLPGASHSPVWSPDGAHILFAHPSGTYWIRTDAAETPQKVAGPLGFPVSLSPDGTRVLFQNGNPFTSMEVSVATFSGPSDHPRLGNAEPLFRAPGFPMPAISPDGRWIAYGSSDSGRSQVYVQPFQGPGGRVAISIEGGRFPVWSPIGHDLFFLDQDARIQIVEYATRDGRFSAGQPRLWSSQSILFRTGGGPFQPYDIAPDGKRFAVMLYPDGTAEQRTPLHLTFLFNFADELHRQLGS
jgi:serine/threonine-protein kinase